MCVDAEDPYKCRALLDGGHWIDLSLDPQGHPAPDWQPPGCMLYDYKPEDISSCFHGNRLVFIGSDYVFQAYSAIRRKLGGTDADGELERIDPDTPTHVHFQLKGVSMDLYWDPFLNSTEWHHELATYRDAMAGGTGAGNWTSLYLVGGGRWQLESFQNTRLDQFEAALDQLIQLVGPMRTFEWRYKASPPNPGGVEREAILLLAPVHGDLKEILTDPDQDGQTRAIRQLNDHLRHLAAQHGLDVAWNYYSMTWPEYVPPNEPGIRHVDVNRALATRANILLNLSCNSKAATRKGKAYPYNRTCCSRYGFSGPVQWALLSTGLIFLPGLYWTPRRKIQSALGYLLRVPSTSLNRHRRRHSLPPSQVLHALAVVTLAVCYCFFADRTQALNKLHKVYVLEDFVLLCLIAFVVGVITFRRTKASPAAGYSMTKLPAPDQPFLSRYQTDEWKGWMQFVVLIYHYTGASGQLQIYKGIRILVASYLFMTGFGHTVYFLKKDDYSLRRVAGVLVRLNLLSCLLPHMMRTDYLFYYFAPLVSFWFLVIYWTLRLGRSWNENRLALLGKVILSALAVVALTQLYGPLEVFFTALRYVCRIDWDLREWRFRVGLDIFIVYAGIICAILHVHSASSSSAPRATTHASWRIQVLHRLAHVLLVAVAFVSMLGFWNGASHFASKQAYNRWHPFISWLPIVSYVILRNATRGLRNVHSSASAWLGRCSLETFTLQYHIWLAADTKGVLSLGVLDTLGLAPERWIEFYLLTVVFLWVSSSVADATVVLTEWIVGGDQRGRIAIGLRHSSERQQQAVGPTRQSSGVDSASFPTAESSDEICDLDREEYLLTSPVPTGQSSGTASVTAAPPSQTRTISSVSRLLSVLSKGVFLIWNDPLKFRLTTIVLAMWILNLVLCPLSSPSCFSLLPSQTPDFFPPKMSQEEPSFILPCNLAACCKDLLLTTGVVCDSRSRSTHKAAPSRH